MDSFEVWDQLIAPNDWRKIAVELQLLEDAEPRMIHAAIVRKGALAVGLSETATWEEVDTVERENIRKESAARWDLPEAATWDEINAALNKAHVAQLTSEGIVELGLSKTATLDDVIAEKLRQLRSASKDQ